MATMMAIVSIGGIEISVTSTRTEKKLEIMKAMEGQKNEAFHQLNVEWIRQFPSFIHCFDSTQPSFQTIQRKDDDA